MMSSSLFGCMFASSAAQLAAKLERDMRVAEASLRVLAHTFGDRRIEDYNLKVHDTTIPHSVVPLKNKQNNSQQEEQQLVIHGLHVQSTTKDNNSTRKNEATETPLVLLHGYMNGAHYYYRNLVGLSRYFSNIYALDMLGWGLSSRPSYSLTDDSVETAEAFFVESLEAWRAKNKVDKMILAGHSMGGYLSVAYCEKYPQHVDRLILLSPVGVPEHDYEERKRSRAQYSLRARFLFGVAEILWNYGTTPGSILRALPTERGRNFLGQYVEHRIRAITDPEEQLVLSNYLYTNAMLPGSGEYCLNQLLRPGAFAKKPVVHRIPKLDVKHVSFLYGIHDWMNPMGGLQVRNMCEQYKKEGEDTPEVDVLIVKDAGHLLMLENWKELNSGVIMAAGGEHTLAHDDPRPHRFDNVAVHGASLQSLIVD